LERIAALLTAQSGKCSSYEPSGVGVGVKMPMANTEVKKLTDAQSFLGVKFNIVASTRWAPTSTSASNAAPPCRLFADIPFHGEGKQVLWVDAEELVIVLYGFLYIFQDC